MSGSQGTCSRIWACRGDWGRWGALLLVWACLAAAVLFYRIDAEGTRELQRSDRAFNRGELDVALDHAQQAALWYLPGAPHVEQALERLQAIAMGAEAAGDPMMALRAWGALRSALHETWHVGPVDENLWEAANGGILRLLPVETDSRRGIRALDDGSSQGRVVGGEVHSAAGPKVALQVDYAKPGAPGPHWALATTLGMLMMLLAGGWLVMRPQTHSGSWWAQAVLAVGLSLWVVAALGA